jgi:isocitrate/isopropylmalate dehydrogenase
MMLRHLAETRKDPACGTAADRIRDAYNACLVAGEKTRDLGGTLGTREFADAVIGRLR